MKTMTSDEQFLITNVYIQYMRIGMSHIL